ncbi:hypothetical protein L1987_03010 [Smallanthus sonchifolius]|uniref:Uncharacterized protein n=1 Tax=Smallanthus sonchifolius TaxID=185202 RepID=A0ACB9K9F2_9ASTR|nr:hypothetical protein L1987_03010 [Smallanthus sonchifolius]
MFYIFEMFSVSFFCTFFMGLSLCDFQLVQSTHFSNGNKNVCLKFELLRGYDGFCLLTCRVDETVETGEDDNDDSVDDDWMPTSLVGETGEDDDDDWGSE